jgi:hypothetical protein
MTDTNTIDPKGTDAYFGPVTRRGAEAADALPDKPPTKIAGEDDYAALKPGTTFVDPDGKTRKKAYAVTDDASYEAVPEGEHYTDPEGKTRQKPKYEGIDVTAQTLYDMSINDKERQKALERSYPGKVKKKGDDFYVEDEGGVLRKPGRGPSAVGGFIASQVAPVGGAIGGSIGGAAVGSVAPGPGTVAGGIAGAAGGSALGQGFNDAILQLAGVYDRSGSEEAANLGEAAAFGAVGEGAGRAIAGAAPFIKGKIANTLPAAAAKFLGADPAGLEQAIGLSEKGVLVPPSGWAKEAPHIQNVVEVFDPAFHTQKPLLQSATEHYEESATNIAESVGAKPAGKFSDPQAAVSTEKAGESILGRTREESRIADENLRRALELRRGAASADLASKEVAAGSHMEALKRAEVESRKAAEAVIDEGFKHIQGDIDTAMKVAKAGGNSGDLWWNVGEKLKAVKQGIAARASKMYGEADALAGDHLPNVEGLSESAADFLAQLPEGFEGRYPSIVKQLRDLAGVEKPPQPPKPIVQDNQPRPPTVPKYDQAVQDQWFENELRTNFGTSSKALDAQSKLRGTSPDQMLDRLAQRLQLEAEAARWLKPPVKPTFGQLHEMRSIIRQNINYHDLTPGIREGVYKFFAKKVDEILHDPEAVPALKDASQALKLADAFYRENMRPLTDKNIQAVVSGLESGLPADPKNLFDTLVKEGRSDLTNKVKTLVGPNLWAGVKAADTQEMLDQAKTLVPGQIDGKRFARQVVDRVRSGMLEAVHGKEASAKLLEQAQRVAMLDGKLDISARPGDTITTIIGKARAAKEAAQAAAKADPLKTLSKEMQGIEREFAAERKKLQAIRSNDPLAFLYKPTTGASEAVDHILGKEDLILAAASKFGDKSPEFNMLRQVWVQRVLQGTLDPGKKLAGVSEEVQRIMFPGVSLDQMKTLAKEMDFLMSSRGVKTTATSMAAVSKVEHPWASIPGGKLAGKVLPGFDAGGRAMLGAYYKMVRNLSNNTALLRWIERGLKGDPVARERSRLQVERAMQMGGTVGAGATESLEQVSNAPGEGP